MTNREKYAEQIVDMVLDGINIAVDEKGRLCDCAKIYCSDCMFGSCDKCDDKLKEWAEQEYDEPAVDWSKVPVDAKILVRDSEDEPWRRRYFARYENNMVYAWPGGSTSYSSCGENDAYPFEYAKLAEENV